MRSLVEVMKFRFLVFILVSAILSGCATLNEDQCNSIDWYTLGSSDGASGKSASTINAHAEACVKFNIVPDREAWRSGWDLGIRQFCTPQRGVDQGRNARYYSNVCPADLAAQFNEGYRIGKRVYDARIALDSLKREIDQDIVALSEATAEERLQLQLRIELKRSRLFDLQNRINDAERDVDRFLYRSDPY